MADYKWALKAVKATVRVDVIDPETKKVISKKGGVDDIRRGHLTIMTEDYLKLKTPYTFRIYLDVLRTVDAKGHVESAKKDPTVFQISEVEIESIPFRDRILFNRFLAKRYVSYQANLIARAAVGGGIAFFIASAMMKMPSSLAMAAGFAAMIVLVIVPPF